MTLKRFYLNSTNFVPPIFYFQVRQKENLLAACEAKISNSSVVSLHHQLKASRDKLRMEQVEQLKKAKVTQNYFGSKYPHFSAEYPLFRYHFIGKYPLLPRKPPFF